MPWVFLWKNFESVQNIQTSQFHVSQKSDGLSWFLFAGVLQGQNEGVGQPDLLLEALEEHLLSGLFGFLAECNSLQSQASGPNFLAGSYPEVSLGPLSLPEFHITCPLHPQTSNNLSNPAALNLSLLPHLSCFITTLWAHFGLNMTILP